MCMSPDEFTDKELKESIKIFKGYQIHPGYSDYMKKFYATRAQQYKQILKERKAERKARKAG